MLDFEKIKQFAKEQESVSVPQIQKQFNLTYRQARNVVDKLVEKNLLIPDGELNFKSKEVKKCPPKRARERTSAMDERAEIRASRRIFLDNMKRQISQLEQNRINNDCSDEKYAEFKQACKEKADEKVTLECRSQNAVYLRAVEKFNNLPAPSQNILIGAILENAKMKRFQLYLKLREKGEEYVKYGETYVSYNVTLSYLLQTSDSGFEKVKELIIKM